MPPADSDGQLAQLRKLLRERAQRAAASALAPDGSVSRENVQSLQNLANLCAVYESTAPRAKSRAWLPASLFIVALGCASLLLFSRVATTVVDVSVTSESGEFRLAQERLLTEVAPVSSIRFIGVDRVTGDPCRSTQARSWPRDVSIAPGGEHGSAAITIEPIQGRKGLSVTVLASNSPKRWELAFAAAPVVIRATLEGLVTINDEPCPAPGALPRTLEAVLNPRASRVIIEFPVAPERFLPLVVRADAISFVRNDFVEAVGQQQASSLLNGSVFLEDLNGHETKLRDGEWLEIGIHGEGWVRPPRASNPALRWTYRGSVDALKSGPADSQRDLRPSWLEYARAQHGLELLWGTALSLFGLGGTLLRWWKPRD